MYATFAYAVTQTEKNLNSETGSFMLPKDHQIISDIITWDKNKLKEKDIDHLYQKIYSNSLKEKIQDKNIHQYQSIYQANFKCSVKGSI